MTKLKGKYKVLKKEEVQEAYKFQLENSDWTTKKLPRFETAIFLYSGMKYLYSAITSKGISTETSL
jgi:hypothetical protein